MSQQIDFLNGKARAEAKRKKLYFQLLRRVGRLRKSLLGDLESVRRNLEGRTDLPPSRRLQLARNRAEPCPAQSNKECQRKLNAISTP